MVAAPKNTTMTGEASVTDTAGIVKDLLVSGILTFLILTPIVAMKTTMNQGSLIIEGRWNIVFWLTLIVVVGRLLLYLFVWNRKPSNAATKVATISSTESSWKEAIGKNLNVGLLIFAILLPIAAHLGAVYGYQIPNFGEMWRFMRSVLMLMRCSRRCICRCGLVRALFLGRFTSPSPWPDYWPLFGV
jgi:hypothetical protein